MQKPRSCGHGGFAIKDDAFAELPQSRFLGQALDKNMVGFFHMAGGREEMGIPPRLVGEQEQPLESASKRPIGYTPLGNPNSASGRFVLPSGVNCESTP